MGGGDNQLPLTVTISVQIVLHLYGPFEGKTWVWPRLALCNFPAPLARFQVRQFSVSIQSEGQDRGVSVISLAGGSNSNSRFRIWSGWHRPSLSFTAKDTGPVCFSTVLGTVTLVIVSNENRVAWPVVGMSILLLELLSLDLLSRLSVVVRCLIWISVDVPTPFQ